jgi:PEP-CTERM motif
MKKLMLLSIVILASNVFAGGGSWLGNLDPADNDWTTASNWENGLPTSADLAIVNGSWATLATSPIIKAGDTAVASTIQIGKGGWGTNPVQLTVEGTLNSESVHIGVTDDVLSSDGILNVGVNGAVNSTWFVVGWDQNGTVNQYGGSVSTSDLLLNHTWTLAAGEQVNYNFYDGELNVTGALAIGPQVLINIEEGIMTVGHDVTADLDNWWAGVSIIGYGGAGTVMYDYDITNPGQTTVWAVPEPASMMLLGVGALALLRRKK